MPSFQDGAVIFVIALLLFGPKKLPELARQLGKLMAEFRRASNEFRMQMEDELRISEQAERQKQIAAMEAAAPVAPALDIPEPEHPHLDPIADPMGDQMGDPMGDPIGGHYPERSIEDARPTAYVEETAEPETVPAHELELATQPLPIASSGDLDLMPPATGLPIGRSASRVESSSLASAFESIPHAEPEPPTPAHAPEASLHG